MEANINSLYAAVLIAMTRVGYDAAIGTFVCGSAVACHVGIVALESQGVLREKPLYLSARHVASSGMYGITALWMSATYVLVWALSSYVANRLRTTEHALRTLNVGLETRVREQVTALERAHRLRRYVAPQLADEILRSEADVTLLRERRPITVMFAERDQAVKCVAMAVAIQRRVRELGDEFVRLGASAPHASTPGEAFASHGD
jgi:hypothetical protein